MAALGLALACAGDGPTNPLATSSPPIRPVPDGPLVPAVTGGAGCDVDDPASTPGQCTCDGQAATIEGTAGDDDLTASATAGADVVVLGAGNDVFDGGDGDDVICGGSGQDGLSGGAGNDRIFGEDGVDYIHGGDGDDTIFGGRARDFIWAGPGNDTVEGEHGPDRIWGDSGMDTISGGDGNDELYGQADDDDLSGGDGNDYVNGGDGADRVAGDAGADKVVGGNGADDLRGGAGDDKLNGGTGADVFRGGDDTDTAQDFDCVEGDTYNSVEAGLPGCAVAAPNDPPVGVDDAYFAFGNHELTIAAAIGLTENDTDGDADPLTAVAETKATTQGGTVTIQTDGSFTYLSPAGYTGLDTFTYTVSDGTDTDTATATMRIDERVFYVDNSFGGTPDGRAATPFTTIGAATGPATTGETIFVLEGSGAYDEGVVLENSQALIGEGVSSAVTGTFGAAVSGEKNAAGSGHETVTLFAGGGSNPLIHRTSAGTGITLASSNTIRSIDVTTADGTGIAGFSVGNLTINPGAVSATGGPAVTIVGGGTISATFASLSSIDPAGAGATVTGVTAGTFTVNGTTTVTNPNAVSPALSFSSNPGLTITFTGKVALTATGSSKGLQISGSGTLTVADATSTVSTTNGTAVEIINTTIGAGGVSFANVSKNGTGSGIVLTNTGAGAFTATGGTIQATTAVGIDIDQGSGSFSFGGTVTNASGRTVEVTNRTGGTHTFSGAIDENGTGINLLTNTGATMTFSGGLDIDTGTNAGFNATGGGTVNVTQNNTTIVNTIDTSTGTGLNLANTTIGASGVTFRSISVDGAASGIVLNATGSSGAFEVTGTGSTDATGGTIKNTTGNAVSATSVRGGLTLRNMVLGDATATLGQAKDATNNVAGDGIDLNGVDDVVLTNLRIARTGGHGIDGTDVTNFSISDSEIYNAGDADGESGISFEGVASNNLDGTATVTNTVVDGAVEFGMRIQNNAGTLALTVSDGQFSGTANTASLMFGEDGIQIEVLGTATTTAKIFNGVVFSTLESDGVMGTTSGNGAAVLNLTIDGNTFTGFDNGAPNMRSDNAVELNATGGTNAGNAPTLRYTVNNNTINSSSNSAILIGANDFTTVHGRITNNTINGSKFGFGIEAPLAADDNSVARYVVTNNTISNHDQQGAFFNANNSGDLDIEFDGNTVSTQPVDDTAFENVLFQLTNGTLCVETAGNDLRRGGANAFGVGSPADALGMIRSGGTALLEVGAAMVAPPSTVLSTNNPSADSVFAAGTISVVGNGTCLAPDVTPTP